MNYEEILKKVDHTLLAPTATWEEIRALCDDGVKYSCASVCIPASYVKKAAEYWSAHKDGKIALSGFVDATGSADKNADLAKERAKAVSKLLSESGVAADRIEMRKPETITAAAGSDQQARRVDITAAQ